MTERPSTTPGSLRMRGWIEEWPDLLLGSLARARETGWEEEIQDRARGSHSIYLGGMGGSAMACRLARVISLEGARLPCFVHQDPQVPGWVAPGVLAGVASYSGDSWEALEMFRAAARQGAAPFAVASGGELLRLAREARLPAFAVPAGYMPRAALGAMLPPILLALGAAEQRDFAPELEAAARELQSEVSLWERGLALPGRDALALARELAGRRIHVYAAGESLRPVALRWKNQLHENAKRMAYEAYFPEIAHTEIVGWSDEDALRESVFVYLEEPSLAEGTRGRVLEASLSELESSGGRVLRVPAQGESWCSRVLSHVAFGDLVSLCLAELRGVDPLPIGAIERVKSAAAPGASGRTERKDVRS